MKRESRRIAMLIFPGFQPLDAIGPLEVFATASRYSQHMHGTRAYEIELLGIEAGPTESHSGYSLIAQRAYRAVRQAPDTLIVAGGDGSRRVRHDTKLLAWLTRMAPRVRRLASVCTGALVLAEAGLLDGRRATTHWGSCKHLQERHPQVRVEPDPIYVQDGHVYTSAGVTAGIDLALALVEQDLGAPLARSVARQLVVFMQRPGGQAQFSAQLAAQAPSSTSLASLQAFIADHPEADLSVPALARRAAMSPRTFARRWSNELGVSPGQYVQQVRVESARRRLEQADESLAQIAERCGFGCEETMRRSFLRVLRVAPSSYRARFTDARASHAANHRRAS
jgi:transcriptional regulator GlxA family with amidase domain